MTRRTMAALTIFFCLAGAGVVVAEDRYRDESGSQYVFAVTRGLNQGGMHPAFKVTLLPLAVVADLVFLPFALVADTMT